MVLTSKQNDQITMQIYAPGSNERSHHELLIIDRRTADVRSVGYAELFSLSREDVLSAMKDYPEAEVCTNSFYQNQST